MEYIAVVADIITLVIGKGAGLGSSVVSSEGSKYGKLNFSLIGISLRIEYIIGIGSKYGTKDGIKLGSYEKNDLDSSV